MSLRILSYCPDRHLRYDGRTPYEIGVGGGVTARVRMAKALYRIGHEVSMVVNCERRDHIDGVSYYPLDEPPTFDGDVLILNTSGGDLDLTPALAQPWTANLKIVWAHGTPMPKGLHQVGFDYVYAVSNFIAEVAQQDWHVAPQELFVAYNAYEEIGYSQIVASPPDRDPFRLVYFSHPSKGLEAALNVLRILRRHDPRYHLVIFGGNQLWGDVERDIPEIDGVEYRGLVGQITLAQELVKCGFSIQLQTRLEPGALAIVEAMRAGCILLGSAVGAYPEMVNNGWNGFLFHGDPDSGTIQKAVADLILMLSSNSSAMAFISRNAQQIIWDTETMAKTWTEHWEWCLQTHNRQERRTQAVLQGTCDVCGGAQLMLADGYHCLDCGMYTMHLNESENSVKTHRAIRSR